MAEGQNSATETSHSRITPFLHGATIQQHRHMDL